MSSRDRRGSGAFRNIAGWVFLGIGIYNVGLGVTVYDFHPVSLVGGSIGILVGALLLRSSRRTR